MAGMGRRRRARRSRARRRRCGSPPVSGERDGATRVSRRSRVDRVLLRSGAGRERHHHRRGRKADGPAGSRGDGGHSDGAPRVGAAQPRPRRPRLAGPLPAATLARLGCTGPDPDPLLRRGGVLPAPGSGSRVADLAGHRRSPASAAQRVTDGVRTLGVRSARGRAGDNRGGTRRTELSGTDPDRDTADGAPTGHGARAGVANPWRGPRFGARLDRRDLVGGPRIALRDPIGRLRGPDLDTRRRAVAAAPTRRLPSTDRRLATPNRPVSPSRHAPPDRSAPWPGVDSRAGSDPDLPISRFESDQVYSWGFRAMRVKLVPRNDGVDATTSVAGSDQRPWASRSHAFGWLALALIVARVAAVPITLSQDEVYGAHGPLTGDIRRFHSITSSHRGDPYRDFPVEYPPVMLGAIELLDSSTTHAAIVATMWTQLALDLIVVALILWGWGRRAALAYLIIGFPLICYPFLYLRLDLLSVALAVAGLALVRRRRPAWGGAVLAVAVFSKLWPILLVPGLVARRSWRAMASFAALAGVGLAAWVA